MNEVTSHSHMGNVEYNQIGKPLVRTDVPGKAVGKTPYAGDYVMPGMLHARVLRSELASARVKKLDATKARELKGVVCIITGDDMSSQSVATDIPGQTGRARLKTEQPVIAYDRIRYHGEPLALIAAETLDIAEQAMRMIEVELEAIPGVYSPQDALKPGAVIVQGEDNIVAAQKMRRGDVEKGMAEADLIVENTFSTQFVEHAFLEPEVGLAWIDENEVINIRVCTQVIEHFRAIADAIGVPHNKVRIRGSLVGGGFGGKEDITVETYLAALAKKTGRPVRLEFTREDSWMGHGKRHPFTMKYRTGVKKDGTITALHAEMIADAGAYVYLSPYVLLYAAVAAPGPYKIDNILIEGKAVATNNMFTSAFRGFGACQACVAYEQQMDEIAKKLGMDHIEFRRKNYLETGDAISSGYKIESAVWTEECVDKAWAGLGDKPADEGHIKYGHGIAAYQQSYGRITFLHDTSQCWVGVEMDGTVIVRSGVTDIGAGQASALAQIAVELLGVTMDNVVVYNSDSAVTPLAGTTTASRALYMTGNAARVAAEILRDRLAERAAKYLETTRDQIDMAFGKVSVRDNPDRSIDFIDLVRMCASEGMHMSELSIFRAPFTGKLDPETGQGQVHPDYVYGAHAARVAVDTETGEVTVLKHFAVHDIGQAINPQAIEGQIEGGTAQGQGMALSEEMVYVDGQLISPSFSEYLIPTAMDMPKVECILLESRSGVGPFGAKGIGEPALTPVAPALANAIADATGIRVPDLPITSEKIVKALREKEANS